ncbi:MAG TPA: DnaJ domain-containing protein [Thermomicrobiales bacterium]|nr:DnaJ domain-containing protein [Thermomicrobiales bacterium]
MSSQQSHQHGNGRSSADASILGGDTYYSLLNVSYDATRAEIRTAYRQSMMRAHPDRAHPSRRAAAEDLSKDLNLAYATLSDPKKRKAYDESIRVQALQSEIMGKYVAGVGGHGFGGPGAPVADAPRRSMSERERREVQHSHRSAMVSVFAAFAFVVLGALVLLVLFALASNGLRLLDGGLW